MDTSKQSLTYPKDRRVRKRADFLQIQRSSKRVGSQHFLLMWRKARVVSSSAKTRFGITISKKVDKLAVSRNLLRRRMKEFLRLKQHSIASGVEIVIIAKSQSVDLSFDEVARELKELLTRAGLYSTRAVVE